jgi:hypothetical protein
VTSEGLGGEVNKLVGDKVLREGFTRAGYSSADSLATYPEPGGECGSKWFASGKLPESDVSSFLYAYMLF